MLGPDKLAAKPHPEKNTEVQGGIAGEPCPSVI